MSHLDKLLDKSVLFEHKRGLRRYFPIESQDITSTDALDEAIFIITGKTVPSDPLNANEFRGQAILFHSIDKYIENWDGSLWVRTIYKVNRKIVSVEIIGIDLSKMKYKNDVKATFDDGNVEIVFDYYPDELSFSPDEFIGLTKLEACMLFRKKDIEYLQS